MHGDRGNEFGNLKTLGDFVGALDVVENRFVGNRGTLTTANHSQRPARQGVGESFQHDWIGATCF